MFTLRPLEAADAPETAVLIRLAFGELIPSLDPAPSAVGETAESVARSLEEGGGCGAVADRLVGVVLWKPDARGLYLGRLSVHPQARRQGVAVALVEAAVAEARRRGLSRVHLGTRLALVSNRALFARLGFIETMQHAHPGYDHPTWVEMERLLC
jgi:predicted N-acetyltransferase YhbS